MRLRVNSLTGKGFRRNGIVFGGAPQVIDTAELGWTDKQVAELLATGTGAGHALHVENVDAPPPAAPELEPAAPATTRSRGR